MSFPSELNNLQCWLQAVITHPNGVAAGIVATDTKKWLDASAGGIESIILPSSEMTSLERLQIYGRAYFGRLIECLQAQFPAVRHAIGNEAFDTMAFSYFNEHPSRNYTLGTLGDSFPSYLAATRPPRLEYPDNHQPDFADFVIELAELEHTYGEVFHGNGPEKSFSFSASDFEHLSAAEFSECRLVPHACVRLKSYRYPVQEYATWIRRGVESSIPIARPVWLVVTRRNYIVRRFEISSIQFELLTRLAQRSTIGEALQQICSKCQVDVASFGAELYQWFREWSAENLFAEFERP